MRFQDHAFDGARRYYDTDIFLRSVVGSVQWFAEFQPVNFRGLGLVFPILRFLYRNDIRGHVGGSYPSYLAWFQTSFNSATVFLELKENPVIKLIFQIGAEPLQTFNTGRFEFSLFEDVEDMDVCRYHVKLVDCQVLITFLGIDSVACGYHSNVDFVHFVLQFNDMLGFRRHAITSLPDPTTGYI
jgi:hypothetical protein